MVLGMFVGDEGGDLLGRHILQDVEPGTHLGVDAIQNLLRLARPHGALEYLAGKVVSALRQPLPSEQMLKSSSTVSMSLELMVPRLAMV